ncbi:MAG: hypothetical protein ACR2PS_12545, partial [Pseudomonadales bacterium]
LLGLEGGNRGDVSVAEVVQRGIRYGIRTIRTVVSLSELHLMMIIVLFIDSPQLESTHKRHSTQRL